MDSGLIKIYEDQTGANCIDSPTGLLNHGFYEMALCRDFERAKRYDETVTIALIDIDSFRHFNTRFGAVEGDRVLREISTLVMKSIREVDLAARYSEDTLAVVFIKSNAKSSMVALERIRLSVEERYSGNPTISVGLASYPNDATTIESLTENAGRALQQAKIKGKNKVVSYSKDTESREDRTPKILVVDDDPRNVKLLQANLSSSNYEVLTAYSGEQALNAIRNTDVDLVLLDVMMPNINGFEVCRQIKSSERTRLIPVILVTALDSLDDKIRGIEAGADDFLSKPPNKMELFARVKSLVNVRDLNRNLTSIEGVLFSLANAVEAKDTYTQGHVERVSNLAMTMGHKMALSQNDRQALKYGGALHDIGKIGVPREIINKPGPLEPEEWEIMKRHPDIGHTICMPLQNNLGAALYVIRSHHEKLDGTGYPDGLKGDAISMAARIMAVVDIFDALTTERPYRKAMSREKALRILRQDAEDGKLDKAVVSTFETLFAGGNNSHEN